MGMKNPIVPASTARRILRIFANHVEHSLQRADSQRFVILRHNKPVAVLLEENFADKLTETFGASEVEGSAWLASMPVSARDHQSPPATNPFYDAVVFNPATSS